MVFDVINLNLSSAQQQTLSWGGAGKMTEVVSFVFDEVCFPFLSFGFLLG